jgi:hypothetical protein
MEKVKYLIIAGAVLIASIIAFIIYSESDEAKVKKQFEFLAEKMKKTPEESRLISATKATKITKQFTKTSTIHAPAYSVSKEIASQDLSILILSTRSQFSKISLKFYDFVIDFPAKGYVDVNLTVNVAGRLTTGEYVDEIHELKCILKKIEDIWLLKEIEIVEVLKK